MLTPYEAMQCDQSDKTGCLRTAVQLVTNLLHNSLSVLIV